MLPLSRRLLRPRGHLPHARGLVARTPQRACLLSTTTDASDRPPVFITTPIFYVNAKPHIGHAYTALLCDGLARWHRIKGDDVVFSTGTDEHGGKVDEAAKKQGKDTQQFCDDVSASFRHALDNLDISYDDFIRTTEPRHKATVERIWNLLVERGHIYLGTHEGWYCKSDESFLTEQQVQEVDGAMVSKESGHLVEWLSEPNYKFKLAAFRDHTLRWLQDNPDAVLPKARFNEAVAMLNVDMDDLSVSRLSNQVSWAITAPTDANHSIYVWLDALVNYITVSESSGKQGVWPPTYQVIGKDILKFHTVYWGAFLQAAGMSLPKHVITHAHWTVDNTKMSKSLGNVVCPNDAVEKVGRDATRYFLLRDGGMVDDGDFSYDMLTDRVNKDLADRYGNLLSRCAKKLTHWPAPPTDTARALLDAPSDTLYEAIPTGPFIELLSESRDVVDAHYRRGEFGKGVDHVMQLLGKTNAFFANNEPWGLAKKLRQFAADPGAHDAEEIEQVRLKLDAINYLTLESVRLASIMLQPVVPDIATHALDQLGIPVDQRTFAEIEYGIVTDGRPLGSTKKGLFMKLR